jgi:hypothetical protein
MLLQSVGLVESPRIAPSVDLPHESCDPVGQCPEPLPEGISRYGVIPRVSRQRTSHGIARRLPAAGKGFAVMSGCAHGVAPVQGSLFVLPDKEFRWVCYL